MRIMVLKYLEGSFCDKREFIYNDRWWDDHDLVLISFFLPVT